MTTPLSDYSDDVTRLYQAADTGDVVTVAALLPRTTDSQRARVLNQASRQDQAAVMALVLPTELGVYGHHVLMGAMKTAAEAGALKALDGLLTHRPALLAEGILGAVLMEPPQTDSLAFLGPRANDATWDRVIEDLLDNEDSHGLAYEACLTRVEVLLPWMSPAYQQKMLRTYEVALLPHTEARVQAHDRAQAAQHVIPDATRRPRRRS